MRNRIIYPALCLMLSVVSSNAQKLYTLEECRTLALENSAKMKNSRFEVEVAKQTSKEAFTNYFPNVSAVGAIFKASEGMAQMDMAAFIYGDVEEREDGRGDFGSTCIYGWSHCQWE